MYIIYCTVCTQHTTTCWLFITAHCLLPRLPILSSSKPCCLMHNNTYCVLPTT
jgi:hypothetical protein